MGPRAPAQDVGDGCAINAELDGQFTLQRSFLSPVTDQPDGVVVELGVTVQGSDLYLASEWSEPSGLGAHVREIFALIAEEEVTDVHASGVVASVKNEEAFRNWPTPESPRHAMSALLMAMNRHKAVPLVVSGALPFPALVAAHREAAGQKLDPVVMPFFFGDVHEVIMP